MQLRLRAATWLLSVCTLAIWVLPCPVGAAEVHTHRGGEDWYMDDPDQHWRLCMDCGEKMDTAPHEWTLQAVEIPGSCTEDRVEIRVCQVCLRTQRTILPAPGHRWDGGKITQSPTCMEKGKVEYTCTVCDKTRTEESELADHEADGIWAENAGQHWQLCRVCGAKQMTTSHQWTGWVTSAGGKQSRRCAVCDRTETRKVTSSVAPDLVAVTPEGRVVQKSFVRDGRGRAVRDENEAPTIQSIAQAFADVKPGAWYADTVTFVYSHGLLQGVSKTEFNPQGTMTRAMLAAAIHRMEGSPACAGNYFSDVAPGTWYYNAVNWAASQGILAGVGEGKFAPHAPLTREQMVAVLYRYAGVLGLDQTGRESLSRFTDSGSISAYAVTAMEWSVAADLISGMGDGRVAPRSTATRAEVATVLKAMTIRITEALGQSFT